MMHFPAGMLFVVAMVAIPFFVISQWLKQRHEEKMANLGQAPERQDVIEARLDRIERAIDTMSIEMERVGEGQRFVTKLLSEQRSPVAELPSTMPKKFDTPH